MGLGERIKTRRLELGLDQKDLAQRLGVGQPTLCEWERGKFRPHRTRIAVIAKALRVPTKTVTAWWLAL